ncbi:hypothetical protein [Streptomyces nigrescens]|uniref:hypothetical protein n=1 Tax=Streptomyces nigrescens TaxID=1920 RepID=UPI00382188E1
MFTPDSGASAGDSASGGSRPSSPGATDAVLPAVAMGGKVPFNRRVYMVIEVIDRPEEIDLLTQLCESLGWPVRLPLAQETSLAPQGDWTVRIVEARIRSVRDGAVQQAVATFDTLAQDADISANCRDATLVEPVHRPLIEWHLRGRRQSPTRHLRHSAHLLTRTAGHDQAAGTVRLVRIPTSLDEPRLRRLARSRRSARTELSRHPLPGRELDADRHVLTMPKTRVAWQTAAMLGLLFVATMLILFGAGLWSAMGLDDPRVGAPVLLLMVTYVLVGTVLALRDTATHRAVPWLLPLAAPLAVPLVPWLGTLVQRAYLSPFELELPPGKEGVGSVLAGTWVLSVFLGTLFLFIAYLGWIRFLNSSVDARGSWTSWTFMLSVGTGLAIAFSLVVLLGAGQSGVADRRLAAQGKDIPEYFGLSADYVCVALPSGDTPYYGVRPPTDRPVISFGQTGDRIELWIPSARQKASLRLEDARIRVVPHLDSSCGTAE